jgi:radical SAM superfamily enzyme YgiQ (UPF0313 family)
MSKKSIYFPLTLSVELVRGCCNRCYFCNAPAENFYLMPYNIWNKIKEFLSNSKVDNLTPFSYGESLLHPFFYDWLEELLALNTEKKLAFNDLVLNTSGVFLQTDRLMQIINKYPASGFHRIHFSLDTFSEKEWKKIGKLQKLTLILEKVTDLLNFKQKNGLKEPLFTFSRVYNVNNEAENDKFINFYKKIFENCGEKYQVYFDIWPEHEKNAIYLRQDTRFLEAKQKFICKRDNVLIRADGDIYLCLSNFSPEFRVGNIRNVDLLTFLQGREFQKFREQGKNGCRNCIGNC